MNKKRMKYWTVLAAIVILLFPIVRIYKDGGTITYTSLTYRIIKWHHRVGGEEIKTGTEVQLFPKNFKGIDEAKLLQRTRADELNQLREENARLWSSLEEVEKTYKPVDVKIFGGFTARVRAVILDENREEPEPNAVVLETFQGGDLILVKIIEERGCRLEVGETYRFELDERELDERAGITRKMLEHKYASLPKVCEELKVPIKTVRLPKKEEYGLESINVFWEEP